MKKEYYFIDINLTNMTIVQWGVTAKATLKGKTEDPKTHRVFLTKGQYNKLLKLLG